MCSKAVKNYDLTKKIGSGGLCTIWEARHRSSNQTFAFKQLHNKSDYGISVIQDEYKFLAFHKFPGLVNAYDFISVAGNTGFIMDYLPGPGLDEICGKLGERKLLDLIAEILETANFIYQSGHIYNDYKPQNFRYDSEGKLKLLDFNLISLPGTTEPKTSGTFGYLAPELLSGQAPSLHSDIYSLGVTFYELACGRMPFEAADEGALIKRITETSPESPGTASENINACLLKMLSRDVTERPQSLHEVARIFGLGDRFQAEIKRQAAYYLDAGVSPYAAEVVNFICSKRSESSPFIILANDIFEHDKLLRDIRILLSPGSCRGKTGIPDIQNQDTPTSARFAENFASGDIDRAGGMYLVNCRDDFNNDILQISHSLAGDLTSGNILLLTTDRSILNKNAGLEIISLIDKPDRTTSYINYFLKDYNAPDDFLERMRPLTNGDSAVIYHYLRSFIDKGAIQYNERAWEVSEVIDYSEVPAELAGILSGRINQLSDEQKTMMEWLAVMNDFCAVDCLDNLAGIESTPILDPLIDLGLVSKSDAKLKCSADALALNIYAAIPAEEKIGMHKKAAEYLEVDHGDKIEAIFRHYREAGDFAQALKYAYRSALKWNDRFDFKKAEEFINSAEDILARIDDSKIDNRFVLQILFLGADIAKSLAKNRRAEGIYNRAAALAEKTDSPESLAKAFKDSGDNYRLQQDPAKSIESTLKALKIYKRLNDEPSQAACFNNLGLAHWIDGDYSQALANFEKSLQLNRALGNLSEQSKIHNNIGIIYDITGRKDEVLGRFEEALKCAVEVKNPTLEAKYLNNIGYFYLNSGKLEKALDYFMRCYNLAGTTGNAEEQLNTVYNIALAYHKMGEFLKSAEANQQGLDIAISLNHSFFAAQAAHLLARDCLALGNYRLSLNMLEQAAERSAELSSTELAADILLTRIELELQLGDTGEAAQYLNDLNGGQIPTPAQKAKAAFANLQLKALTANGLKESDVDNLINSAHESRSNETVGLAILEKAALAIAGGRLELAGTLLAEYNSLALGDLLMNFEYSLLMGQYLSKNRQYNEALEITADVRATAENKGCLPVLFKALVLEASILQECRKSAQAAKTIKQAEAVDNILVAAIPDNRNPGNFHNSYYGKIFNKLIKERAAGAEIQS